MKNNKSSEVADYLNNFEKRKKFMEKVKHWAVIFFVVSYGYFLYEKITSNLFTTHKCRPCNTASAIDSVRFMYEYKLDSVINAKQNKTKRKEKN